MLPPVNGLVNVGRVGLKYFSRDGARVEFARLDNLHKFVIARAQAEHEPHGFIHAMRVQACVEGRSRFVIVVRGCEALVIESTLSRRFLSHACPLETLVTDANMIHDRDLGNIGVNPCHPPF